MPLLEATTNPRSTGEGSFHLPGEVAGHLEKIKSGPGLIFIGLSHDPICQVTNTLGVCTFQESSHRGSCVFCFQRVVLKFVVGITENLDAELEPIDALVRTVEWPERDVILMPEGITPDALNAKSASVIAASIARGYRFGTRFHTLAWGNKRGV